ncbi:cytochrome b/b6 domain-containing protein [Lentisalinibacter orientalis]|uniref:cytochrome b/b6 domain-containing protein n=1 Tax=Lentisalinibacter orientalis TaxID=2992241 RepID=UPI003865B060
MKKDTDRPAAALVWDLPLRLFHWLLVVALAGSWITHELGVNYMDWHMRLGYLVIGLIVFRLLWGFVGPRHARFGQFLRGPGAVVAYARDWLAGRARVSAGHNPLGGWSVLAMLAVVSVQAVTGLFNTDDVLTSGPWHGAVSDDLADTASWLHAVNFNLLLALTGLHVASILAYWLRLRIDLATAMFTGRKRGVDPAAGIAGHRLLLALVLAALAAGTVWLLVDLAPEPAAADFLF